MATEVKNNVSYLDNVCSNHMTRDKSIVIDLGEFIKTDVKMGNGVITHAQELDTIGVQTKQGTKFIHDFYLFLI